jgi:hypothetical protein
VGIVIRYLRRHRVEAVEEAVRVTARALLGHWSEAVEEDVGVPGSRHAKTSRGATQVTDDL